MTARALRPDLPPEGPLAPVSGAQSVERALTLLSLVGRGGAQGRGLTDLVSETGLSRPTARRLLVTLASAGLIEQDQVTRRYYPGSELFLLGSLAASRHDMLGHAADSLRRLAQQTGDTAFVSVPQGDYILCLHREDGSFPIRTHALQKGDLNPLGAGAGGLAVLAAMPKAQADAVLARLAGPLEQRMGAAAGDLGPDVDLARERGYSVNPGRVVPGSWGIGVPVRWPDGTPAAALSIAAIEARLTSDRQPHLAALLQAEARLIEASLAGPIARSNDHDD